MHKLKLRKAKAKPNNGGVVVYFSHASEEMRFPTGIKLEHGKDKNGKYVQWNYKEGCLKLLPFEAGNKSLVAKFSVKQQKIDELVKRANGIILDYFNREINITVSELTDVLSNQQRDILAVTHTSFFNYYDEFIEEKKRHFNANGRAISIKDYISTRNLFMDYQKVTKKEIRIRDFNKLKLDHLVQFMAQIHPKFIDTYNLKTKGEMKPATIKKRLAIFVEFFNYLKFQGIVTGQDVDIIRDCRKRIKNEPVEKETLEIHEIHALYKYQFTSPALVKIRDVFVFLCLTGIRYQDLVDFDPRFIQKSKDGNGLVYKKAASKTSINYQVPLCKIVIEILQKYDYKLPVYSGQYGNIMIKSALKETGMFNSTTQLIDKKTKGFKARYQAITMHKGRNTFITNLVDHTPLNELMKYTGHKKLSTLQSYIDVKRPVKMDYIQVFDIK